MTWSFVPRWSIPHSTFLCPLACANSKPFRIAHSSAFNAFLYQHIYLWKPAIHFPDESRRTPPAADQLPSVIAAPSVFIFVHPNAGACQRASWNLSLLCLSSWNSIRVSWLHTLQHIWSPSLHPKNLLKNTLVPSFPQRPAHCSKCCTIKSHLKLPFHIGVDPLINLQLK